MNVQAAILPGPPRAKFWPLRVAAVVVLWVGASFVAALFLLSCFPLDSGFLESLLNGKLVAAMSELNPVSGLIGFNLGLLCYSGWHFRSRGRRVWLGLGIAGLLTVDVGLMAYFPKITDPLVDRVIDGQAGEIALFLGVVALIPLGVLAALWRLRSWRWITAGYIVLGGVLLYLAKDEPLHPAALEQTPPGLPGDKTSFNVLMRYGKNHPLGRGFQAPNRIFTADHAPFVEANKPTEWPAWLVHHQAAVEADWADLAPVRRWIEEVNGFDSIGDLTPAKFDAEIITFAPLRSYTQHACQIAGLQAIAGQGDEAIATVLPLLQVSRKMEPASRTLVRTMIARVMQKQAITAVNFVLDTTTVSKAMRARLVEVLSTGTGGEAGVRHILAIEGAYMVAGSEDYVLELIFPSGRPNRALVDVVSPFIYNKHRTLNFYQDLMGELQVLAARRDVDGLQRTQRAFFTDRYGPKNYMGRVIVLTLIPAYSSIVKNYWTLEDMRSALLARLAKS